MAYKERQIDRIVNLAANGDLYCSAKLGDTRYKVELLDWNDDKGTVTVLLIGFHQSVVPWEVAADSIRLSCSDNAGGCAVGNLKRIN